MKNKLPTIDIKGKEYTLVKDRVLEFNRLYPNGDIHTKIVSYENKRVVVMAKVTPDVDKPTRFFTGYSQADESQGLVNATAALENAETSACGRALAFMGIGVIESIASADEMNKALVGLRMPSQTVLTPENDVMTAYNEKESQTVKECPIHDVQMGSAISAKTNARFWYHDSEGGRCFGKGYQSPRR